MSSNSKFFLKKTLGENFEVLFKTEIFKQGTRSVVDTEDIEHGLKLVPRTVMAFLIRELVPMAVGEHKEIVFPAKANVIIKVTKTERDCVSGEVIEDNKKIYDFINRTIPGLGLVLLSSLELYDIEDLKQEPKEDEAYLKVQKLIDERLTLHELVNKVVDQKIAQKDAIKELMLAKLTHKLHETKEELVNQKNKIAELNVIHRESTPMDDEYFRGMANGFEVVDSIVNDREPSYIDKVKKESPLKSFLNNRKNKKPQFNIRLTKSEHVDCPDCGGKIFNGTGVSACICFGDSGKVYLKKSETGYTISFGRGWDPENIQMLLEVLRSKRG